MSSFWLRLFGLLACGGAWTVSPSWCSAEEVESDNPFAVDSLHAKFVPSPLGKPAEIVPVVSGPVTQPAGLSLAVAEDCQSCDAGQCPFCPNQKPSTTAPAVIDLPELLSGSDASAIETIKRKLGINLFAGTLFNTTPDAAPAGVCEPAQVESQCSPFQSSTCEIFASPAVANSTYYSFSPATHRSLDDVAALRDCGHMLDEAAHRLESQNLFDQADAVRQTAQSLRLKARDLHAVAAKSPVHSTAPQTVSWEFEAFSAPPSPPPPMYNFFGQPVHWEALVPTQPGYYPNPSR